MEGRTGQGSAIRSGSRRMVIPERTEPKKTRIVLLAIFVAITLLFLTIALRPGYRPLSGDVHIVDNEELRAKTDEGGVKVDMHKREKTDLLKCDSTSSIPSTPTSPLSVEACQFRGRGNVTLPLGCKGCDALFPGSWGYSAPWTGSWGEAAQKYGGVEFAGMLSAVRQAAPDGVIAALERATRSLSSTRTVVDIGAGTGQDLRWIFDVFGARGDVDKPATEVHAFEPNPWLAKETTERASQWAREYKNLALKVSTTGVGDDDGPRTFWRNKDTTNGSFIRLRSENSEQQGTLIRVRRLDAIYGNSSVKPVMLKIGAHRWEYDALSSGGRTLAKVPILLVDVTAVKNNSGIVRLLTSHNYAVYAMGCHSLARIPADRPWWWSTILAVKPFLQHVVDPYTCWDFTANTTYECDSYKAAKAYPLGCRNTVTGEVLGASFNHTDEDVALESLSASPETIKVVKTVAVLILVSTIAAAILYLVAPLVHALLAFYRAV